MRERKSESEREGAGDGAILKASQRGNRNRSWRDDRRVVRPPARTAQLTLFEGAESAIAQELRRLDLDKMTPLDAINKLREFTESLLGNV
jgi:hypothetical protein